MFLCSGTFHSSALLVQWTSWKEGPEGKERSPEEEKSGELREMLRLMLGYRILAAPGEG